MPYLNDIVEGIKKSLNSKQDDYITVMIVALIGTEEEVLEAEITCDTYFHQGDLPCKSARITLGNWKGKEGE